MIKNVKDIAMLYGVKTPTARKWLKDIKIKDTGRDHNNKLTYDSKDYRILEKYIVTTHTGKTRLVVSDEIRAKAAPKETPKDEIRKGTCEACGKPTSHWRRVTCGDRKCKGKIYKSRGLTS